MTQTEEYKTVKVPAGKTAQTKALNKLAEDGWQVVDKHHTFGAGIDTVTVKRPYVPKPQQPNPVGWLLGKLVTKLSGGVPRG